MSVPLSVRVRNVASGLIEGLPAGDARALAVPDPDSGLAPVLGDPGVPFVGHTLGFLQSSLDSCRRFHARFGPIFWVNAFGTKIVMVLGPDALEEVLANRERAYSNQQGWDYFIGPFFERGVMLMDFEEHRQHRRILQQAFTRERLVAYLDTMNPAITRGIDSWPQQRDFPLYPAVKALTLDVATHVFMGDAPGPENDRLNRAFIDTVVGGQAFIRADVPAGRWHRGLRSRELLAEYFRSQIPAKRAGDGQDLFSVLCRAQTEEGETFSDTDVVNHMIFTMMAAHDTSTITASMLAYYLARHPDWQERVREECLALEKPAIGFDDLEALPLLDLAFRETLRINAPVGMLARQATRDTALCGHFIPAGTRLMLSIYPSQRMEPWWSEPDTFDPLRFSPERAEDKSHKYAWVPFGANVHKCIGMHFGSMEVKAILYTLLRRFRLSITPGYEPPIDYGTGPQPADGLPLHLSRL
ncbi:MAG TPA: cytochrome P450 [Solirubrobacteraceae bacterium]|nr:cytochrome P450 [Solirubrobacteraceae bacterium]